REGESFGLDIGRRLRPVPGPRPRPAEVTGEGGALSTQETQDAPAWPAAGGPQTLASDADRDTAIGLLNAAWAEGRLTADEHDQRLSAAYAARTWQQLDRLTADLPAPPAAAIGQPVPGMFARAGLCLRCAAGRVPPGRGRLAVPLLASRTDRSGSAARRDQRSRCPGGMMTGGGVAERYRRAVAPAVRGAAGVVAVAFFAVAAAVGGRGGGGIARAWVAGAGGYCLAGFWHFRGRHGAGARARGRRAAAAGCACRL